MIEDRAGQVDHDYTVNRDRSRARLQEEAETEVSSLTSILKNPYS